MASAWPSVACTWARADAAIGAPYDEFLQLCGLDQEGLVALQVCFDIEDMDAAMAELDATHARLEDEQARSAAAGKHGGSRIRERLVAFCGSRLGCRDCNHGR